MISSTKISPKVPRVMEAGDLAPLVAKYAAELAALDHTRLTVANYADPARHFAAWLRQADVALVDLDRRTLDRFARHVCRCGGSRQCEQLSRRYVRRVRRFIAFLVDRGLIASLAMPVPDVIDPHVADYQQWLKRHRGICESTAKRHGLMVMRLLAVLGRDPLIYDAGLIRRAIVAEAKRCSPSHVKTMTTALRGYLRFLAAAGICPPGLDRAVPLVPQWRLSSLPRYLSAADVDRLIASCDLGTAHGIRDRAILLLFARLDLRAGDVLNMLLDDIDWAAGTVLVSGKGRREVCLPLPQEVGDALLDYIDQARPVVKEQRLFLRSCAPYRPFTSPSTISCVVSLALRRAGIEDPPSRGANLLRHSAATAMLRGGATLQSVGAVLRHRSLDTTAHYAKVNLPMLEQIAQPWPGEGSC
jgi:site-specific recombinase XerD